MVQAQLATTEGEVSRLSLEVATAQRSEAEARTDTEEARHGKAVLLGRIAVLEKGVARLEGLQDPLRAGAPGQGHAGDGLWEDAKPLPRSRGPSEHLALAAAAAGAIGPLSSEELEHRIAATNREVEHLQHRLAAKRS